MSRFIDIHTHFDSLGCSIKSVRVGVDMEIDGLCCVAIHPWDISLKSEFHRVETLALTENVIAIGETGLDFYRAKTIQEREEQKKMFIAHIELANRSQLPLIIHSVKANNEVYSILKQYNKNVAVIIHGFIGSIQEALAFTSLCVYLSFSSRAVGSQKTIEAFKHIEPTYLFCETDNDNTTIEEVYRLLSTIKECEIDKLKKIIENSYNKIFNNG